MKRLIVSTLAASALAASVLAAMAPAAQAASVNTGTFTVDVTLTPACSIVQEPGNIAVTYTSFQVGASTGTTTFKVQCTNTKPYTMALDTNSGTVLGLPYTLALRDSGDAGDVAGGTGNGLVAGQSYLVKATVGGLSEGGNCNNAAVDGTCAGSSGTHLVTITY